MKVDADSRKFLEEVRKGRPRRFVMVCNGVKILNLIVYKKGSEAKYKKQARKADGAGQFFSGVITGKGRNIVFELSRQEYDRTPGKDVLLKQFLEDEAELSCRPCYELVETLTPLDASEQGTDDPEQPTDTLEAAAQEESAAESQLAESQPASSEPASTEPAQPQSKPAHAEPDASQPGSGSFNTPREQRRAEKAAKISAMLHASLDDLRPLLDEVLKTHADAEEDLVNEMSDIVDQITKHDFTQARHRIADLAHALQVLAQRAPGTS